MKKLLMPFWRLYVWVIWFPLCLVLTAITAITVIIMSWMRFFSLRVMSFPPKVWAKLICWLAFVWVEFKGKENIKEGQSYVIASNHQSAFDIWAIYGWLPVTFSWIMKKELRKMPFVGLACERLGDIFIDRSNPIEAKKSLKAAEEKLHDGHCIVIFPEGTRTKTGKVGNFKRGAFSIATDLNLPVLPTTIKGSYERFACGGYSINPGKITVTIHEPISPEGNTEQDMRNLSQKTKEAVVSLLPDNMK
ncbi:MAG: 1-acyl-sn-glycerol-3-phosphate acyltransferase [Paludibacteraceae bacterium]|nr:1-acyl-sn-glycerol-3-phosphate acyltransferase [Paludibacteraceae bacterium]